MHLVLYLRYSGLLACVGGVLADSVLLDEYVPKLCGGVWISGVFAKINSAKTDPTYDQIQIRTLLDRKDEVHQEQLLDSLEYDRFREEKRGCMGGIDEEASTVQKCHESMERDDYPLLIMPSVSRHT